MLQPKTKRFATRRNLFKNLLARKLRKIDVDLQFLRLEKEPEDSKWRSAWKLFIEFNNESHVLRSKIYKNEKPFSIKVIRDLVTDIKHWKESEEA